MTSELKVDKITPASGTNTQIGEAGDTTNLSAGTVTLPTSIITGATEKTSLVDADKFLISDSADSNAFKHVQKSNLPSGGLVYLGGSESSSSASAVTFDSVFSSTYRAYKLIGMVAPSQDTFVKFRFRSGGSDVNANTYITMEGSTYVDNGGSVGQANVANYQNTYSFIGGNDINSDFNSDFVSFDLTVTDPNTDIFSRSMMTGTFAYRGATSSRLYSSYFALGMHSNTDNDGIKFETNAGTLLYHSIRVYGMVNS